MSKALNSDKMTDQTCFKFETHLKFKEFDPKLGY